MGYAVAICFWLLVGCAQQPPKYDIYICDGPGYARSFINKVHGSEKPVAMEGEVCRQFQR